MHTQFDLYVVSNFYASSFLFIFFLLLLLFPPPPLLILLLLLCIFFLQVTIMAKEKKRIITTHAQTPEQQTTSMYHQFPLFLLWWCVCGVRQTEERKKENLALAKTVASVKWCMQQQQRASFRLNPKRFMQTRLVLLSSSNRSLLIVPSTFHHHLHPLAPNRCLCFSGLTLGRDHKPLNKRNPPFLHEFSIHKSTGRSEKFWGIQVTARSFEGQTVWASGKPLPLYCSVR